MNALPSLVPAPVTAAEVVESLDRILGSEAFSGSPTLGRFLRYVVTERLAGREAAIKEYTIAVEALGREPGFDPASSSAVRVAARQLRFKLQEYYAGPGRSDPVVISLPKGTYVPSLESAAPSALPPAPETPVRAGPKRRVSRSLLLAVLLTAALGVWLWRLMPDELARTSVAPAVIAVLPFANLSGTSADDFISDGLADEVTSALAVNAANRVISRTSAWTFKGTRTDVREVGRRLGATYVLEGSLHRSGKRYRVSVQLNAASDGASVWAEQYELERGDVFGVYDTIAQAVHEALNARLQVPAGVLPVRRSTRDAVANALYLEGRYFWNQRTPESMRRALSLFEQAVARDSTFALGWAGLAGVLATMEVNHHTPPGVSAPKAFAAAARARTLDPTLGEPLAAVGLLRGFVEWKWLASDSAFRQAVALSPNYATARSWYSNTLLARGHVKEALEQLEVARQLDPLSMPIAYGIAQAHYYGRQWDEGLVAVERVLELNPGFSFGVLLKGKLLKGMGRIANARLVFAQLADSIELALLLPLDERRREIPRLLLKLPKVETDKAQFWMATHYAQIGAPDMAFQWLDRAFAVRQPDLSSLLTDPMIDPLKADPRYHVLLRRIGLAGESLAP